MRLFGWFKGPTEDPRLKHWRDRWHEAVKRADTDGGHELARELEALGLPEEEIEIEREMLEALQQFAALARSIDASGLPIVETGHRIVGTDVCHMVALASMPDEPGQPAGRLLLTNARAVFAGGKSASVPWHAVADVVHQDRDLLLARADRTQVYRFRCNALADALCGALLARRLCGARRRNAPGL